VRIIVDIKRCIKCALQNLCIRILNFGGTSDCSDEVVLIDTSIGTSNIGDEIIMLYVRKALSEIIQVDGLYRISSHIVPSYYDIQRMIHAKMVLICGTNILAPQMEINSNWAFDNRMIKMRNAVLIGCGWKGYKRISAYSKYVYNNVLSKHAIHSVRDNQTVSELNKIGVTNVLNTNCITMWGLDKISVLIPIHKAQEVVFTLNSSNRSEKDIQMIDVLCKNYRKVFFFPQGKNDLSYYKEIASDRPFDIVVINRSLERYTKLLSEKDIDYVGIRLHGGIHALHYKRRSIIVAIDNRATEMAKGTNLPIIKRGNINELDDMINSTWRTNIKLNNDNIAVWKKRMIYQINGAGK